MAFKDQQLCLSHHPSPPSRDPVLRDDHLLTSSIPGLSQPRSSPMKTPCSEIRLHCSNRKRFPSSSREKPFLQRSHSVFVKKTLQLFKRTHFYENNLPISTLAQPRMWNPSQYMFLLMETHVFRVPVLGLWVSNIP